MSYLTKENALIKRDSNGELLPVEVELTLLPDKPLVKVLPFTKGEMNDLNQKESKEQEIEIIFNKCIEPKFTREEILDLKPNISSAIVVAISALSLGLSQEEFSQLSKKTKDEDPFADQKKTQ